MSDAEVSDRIEDLETRIERLLERIEQCRKAMVLSRAAIWLGIAAFVAIFTIATEYQTPAIGVTAFTSVIGGLVWLGANKSTKEEAESVLRRTEAERLALIEHIDMKNVSLR